MNRSEGERNIKPQKGCSYCFLGPKRGVCDMVSQVDNQAKDGGMKDMEDWQNYINRVQEKALPQCLFPDQLTEAINNAKPVFVEEDK